VRYQLSMHHDPWRGPRISKIQIFGAAKRFAARFVYLWVLLGLFAFHRSLISPDGFLEAQALAAFNAFVLAKVMFAAEELHVAENFSHRPLLYPILFRSAIFSVILVAFYFVEEVVSKLWRGNTVVEGVDFAGRHFLNVLSIAFIIFVALIPYFAFSELARVIGRDKLRNLLLSSRQAKLAQSQKP
jgi:hypothetical protein